MSLPWPANARIVQVDVQDGTLAALLTGSGESAYLGIVRDAGRQAAIAQADSRLAERLVVGDGRRISRQNNADVLILSGSAPLGLWQFRGVRHAEQIGLPLAGTLACWAGVLLGLLQCVARRFGWPTVVRLAGADGGGSVRLILFRNRRRCTHLSARRFIPHRLGVAGFLAQLEKRGIRYTVLRWFDALPELPPGEDLDLLVDDADLPAVWALIEKGPGTQPIDVYSVSGLPGANFRGLPYYPPAVAEQLLARRVSHKSLSTVPAPRDHFLSLAYHALYHKGYASGLPKRMHHESERLGDAAHAVPNEKPDHDYPAVLAELAERLGIETPITLEDLDVYLDSQGWRPSREMLQRLARHNRWIRAPLSRPPGKLDRSPSSRAG